MALIHSFEKSGNFLFRHRGEMPVILFILAIPAIYLSKDFRLHEELVLPVTIFSVLISLLGLIIRSYTIGTTPKGTSGRNTKEGQVAESLNTLGIYSIVRHPLYLGNFFMWIGIVFFTLNIWFILLVSLLFWIYYERIMYAEERFLEKKYGEAYLSWSMKVPAFLPALRKFRKGNVKFSFRSVLRREYSGFLATVIGFVFVDHLGYYFATGKFDIYRVSSYILVIAIIITLILRTLKHNTRLLHEEGRS